MTYAPSTPPGWHPDPTGMMTLRWWNGYSWTEHLAPMPNATAMAFQPALIGSQGTSGMAVASLVLGIVWIGGIGSLLAIIFGGVAHGQIQRSRGTLGGAGMAVAGLTLGLIGLVLAVLFYALPAGS